MIINKLAPNYIGIQALLFANILKAKLEQTCTDRQKLYIHPTKHT